MYCIAVGSSSNYSLAEREQEATNANHRML